MFVVGNTVLFVFSGIGCMIISAICLLFTTSSWLQIAHVESLVYNKHSISDDGEASGRYGEHLIRMGLLYGLIIYQTCSVETEQYNISIGWLSDVFKDFRYMQAMHSSILACFELYLCEERQDVGTISIVFVTNNDNSLTRWYLFYKEDHR